MNRFYNVPLDELIKIIDNALLQGFTVDWEGDVSGRASPTLREWQSIRM
jgi:hypothetical protein